MAGGVSAISHRRFSPDQLSRLGTRDVRGGRLGRSPVSEDLLSLPGFVVPSGHLAFVRRQALLAGVWDDCQPWAEAVEAAALLEAQFGDSLVQFEASG